MQYTLSHAEEMEAFRTAIDFHTASAKYHQEHAERAETRIDGVLIPPDISARLAAAHRLIVTTLQDVLSGAAPDWPESADDGTEAEQMAYLTDAADTSFPI